jgi:hypothetical protein
MKPRHAIRLLQDRIAAAQDIEAGVVADLRIREEYPILLGLLQTAVKDGYLRSNTIIEAAEKLQRLPVPQ